MGKPRTLILAGVLAATVTLFLLGALGGDPPAPQVTFVSLRGDRIATGDLAGKVVIVNFWATDCATCVKEMPQMARIYERYRERGFEFIAVAMRHDPPNHVLRYAEQNRLPFTVALDPVGSLAQAFGEVRLTPTTFVIDRRGNIVRRIQGEPDFAKLDALLEEKLKES